jgi:hypothetical protein
MNSKSAMRLIDLGMAAILPARNERFRRAA